MFIDNRTPIQSLMCEVPRRIGYDPAKRLGTVYMKPYCCTYMSGVINSFTSIGPNVRSIVTIAGDEPDTVYRLESDRWQAYNAGSRFDAIKKQ